MEGVRRRRLAKQNGVKTSIEEPEKAVESVVEEVDSAPPEKPASPESESDVDDQPSDTQPISTGNVEQQSAPVVKEIYDSLVFASSTPEPEEPDWLDRYERWVPLVLTMICAFTRFYRLDKPPGVVFDEYHFGRFTNQYSEYDSGHYVVTQSETGAARRGRNFVLK